MALFFPLNEIAEREDKRMGDEPETFVCQALDLQDGQGFRFCNSPA
jgi:hypothetical protein